MMTEQEKAQLRLDALKLAHEDRYPEGESDPYKSGEEIVKRAELYAAFLLKE